MWAHSITNVGDGDLLTLFWANDIFDPAAPDTYAEQVILPAAPPLALPEAVVHTEAAAS
jgi:UDP-2-acetamido-2,6-beta-L-arabino-hexul-4-ose reductase